MDLVDVLSVNQFDKRDDESDAVTDESPTSTSDITAGTHRINNSFSAAWAAKVHQVQKPIKAGLVAIARWSVTNPKIAFYGCIVTALGIFVGGLMTNFKIQVDGIWTPMGSRPESHMKFIEEDAGFPVTPRALGISFHYDGENILGEQSAELVFVAIDAIRSLPDYNSVCATHEDGKCRIGGITRFWNNSYATFKETVSSDQDAIMAMSKTTFGDGGPVTRDFIYGTPIVGEDGKLKSVLAYFTGIFLPDTDKAANFEADVIDLLLNMRDAWNDDPTHKMHLEFVAARSFDDEFLRAIRTDLILVPLVFIVMSIFTCAIFVKKNKVQSRSLLGLGAVVSVLLSIITGFGFMFMWGMPFTSLTQILPFILFGIGLDDAFIMTGSYCRTDPNKTVEERIQETVEDIGISIFVTTVTSVLAFGLGALTNVPAMHWLCIYALFTIACVLFFQVTFFVAAITLDERRIQEKRCDFCTCLTVADESSSQVKSEVNDYQMQASVVDRFMLKFSRLLLQPVVKVAVIVSFVGFACFCAYCVSKLEQKFDYNDVLPSDSYVTDFLDTQENYSSRTSPLSAGVYFRFVDQSDPLIQEQMENFVNDLTGIQAIKYRPANFWLRDFKKFVGDDTNTTFIEQLDNFLDNEIYRYLYESDIVRDENGNITVSRCFISMDNVDLNNVKDQIKALEDQRFVAGKQPVNQGRGENWAFFTFEETYKLWQFYANAVDEIILTALVGIIAVSMVASVLVPHWTAALFVLPLLCILYIDLLGFMHWFGIDVDVVVYVSLAMSIGLLVDFMMHTLLRYYEATGNREEKVVEMLSTMGSSILLGATSTLLGTIPLALCTSKLFFTVFVAFLGLVLLGSAHGLIFLPVLLSIFGPQDQARLINKVKALPDR